MKRPKDIFDRAASGGCVSRLVRFFIFRMQEVVVRYDGGYVRHVWNGPRSTKEIAIKTHRAILAAESCGKVLDVDARVIQGRKLEAVMKIPIIGSLIKCAGKWCSLEVFSQERDELRSDVRANHCDGELPSGSAADSESGGVGIHKNSLANVKEHAPLSAGASVDHGVEVETTGEHENRAADRSCCVSTCCASLILCEGNENTEQFNRLSDGRQEAVAVAELHQEGQQHPPVSEL